MTDAVFGRVPTSFSPDGDLRPVGQKTGEEKTYIEWHIDQRKVSPPEPVH